jgi:hypothetical protein
MARQPKVIPGPAAPVDRPGKAVQGQCKNGGRCWGPFRKIGGVFPMKLCKICGRKS